jgi:hypothetical protein
VDIALLLLRGGGALTIATCIVMVMFVMKTVISEEESEMTREMVKVGGWLDQIVGIMTVALGVVLGAAIARHDTPWTDLASTLFGLLLGGWIRRFFGMWVYWRRHRRCTPDHCVHEIEEESAEEE